MTLETTNLIMSISVLGAQAVILIIILTILFKKKSKGNTVLTFITKNAILLALLVALGATLGSLYYSEIIEFSPCKLCWIQRIFLFPQVVLLGLAYYRDEKHIIDYSLLLSIIGLGVALFQYYGQLTGSSLTDCSAGGLEISCNAQYVTYFGYITIPLMSATAFATITAILGATKIKRPKEN